MIENTKNNISGAAIATKLILERTTIKSLEYLGNEVIRDYPY